MKKVKYKGKIRYKDKKGNIVTEEGESKDVSDQLSQSEMDEVRERIRVAKQDDIAKQLSEDAVRHEKAGDIKEMERALKRRAIYLKSIEK